jgi:putative ABC transport system permease protein
VKLGASLGLLAIDAAVAWRQLHRQRRRTAFGLLSVAFGVAALIFATGFIEYIYYAMREGTIRSRIGHVQVARSGYLESGRADPFRFVLPGAAPELAAIGKLPGVVSVAQRIEFSGLASLGDATISFIGEAIEPGKEVELSQAIVVSSGRNLDDGDETGTILGEGLAANLGARVGDRLVLLANTPSGGINAVEVTVLGLFSSATKAFDDAALRVHVTLARRLLRIDGAHLWVLALDRTERTDEVAARLTAMLDPARFEVAPWHRLADFYAKTVELFSRQVGVLKLVIALLILLVISNTVTMNVLERTGEIGTGLAIGVSRWRMVRQFLLEGALLGTAGGVLGVAIGAAFAAVVSSIGIPMPPPPGLGRGFTAEVMATPRILFDSLLLASVSAVVATVFPAWRVSRLPIVDALRQAR